MIKNRHDSLSQLKNVLINRFGSQRVKIDELLSRYTSLNLGGAADIFLCTHTIAELQEAMLLGERWGTPVIVFGAGTKLLIGDKRLSGLAIKNDAQEVRIAGVSGSIKALKKEIKYAFLEVDSGTPLNKLVRFSLDEGWSGIESFLGQPGTVGGAIWSNLMSIKEVHFNDLLVEVTAMTNRDIFFIRGEEIQKQLAKASLKQTKSIIMNAKIRLTQGEKTKLWDEANQVVRLGPGNFPKKSRFLGPVFQPLTLKDVMQIHPPNHSRSPEYLLRQAHLAGYIIGGAQFSTINPNYITTSDTARSADVRALIREAKWKAKDDFGILLEEAVTIVGEF